ncbi:MAG: hypothetical protein ACRDRJ_02140 [Streptosporangiaceae bacterium]
MFRAFTLPDYDGVVVVHSIIDWLPPRMVEAGLDLYANVAERLYPRPRAEVERFFDGLDLVTPYEGVPAAVTHVGLWGAEDPGATDSDGSRVLYCGARESSDRGHRGPSLRAQTGE